MRTEVFAAVLMLAVPALGAEAAPHAPPSPSPITYEVWGFRWDGHQYAKQTTHSLSTPEIKKAEEFAAQVTGYAGWTVTTNLPTACVVHTVYRGPAISYARLSAFPDKPTYAVWAFQLSDGKWVKDEAHSWTTRDPLLGLDYAKKVNVVPGWCATTNCPEPVPQAQRFVDGGTVHGSEYYKNYVFQRCEALYDPAKTLPYAADVRLQSMQRLLAQMGMNIDLSAAINNSYASSSDDTSSYYSPTYSDTSDIQNSIAIQDSINTQNMINNQNMLNTQDMINTQNMVNNMQDAVNAQNLANSFQPNP